MVLMVAIEVLQLTEIEVARVLGTDVSQIKKMVAEEALIGYKCPKDVLRITSASVIRLIENGYYRSEAEKRIAKSVLSDMLKNR